MLLVWTERKRLLVLDSHNHIGTTHNWMTKGGIHAFTRSLATHLIDRGIRVNAVAPGPVWTPLNPADKSADKTAKFGSDTPMKRPPSLRRSRRHSCSSPRLPGRVPSRER
jgi:NAD(P)-dependent dehydrogenase (short-subunit alcohol dehydrogenase family)